MTAEENQNNNKKKNQRGNENCFFFLDGGIRHFCFPRWLEEYGKKHFHKLWKYVQSTQQGQRVEDARRQLCQVITTEKSERKQQEIKLIKYSGLELIHRAQALSSRILLGQGDRRRKISG